MADQAAVGVLALATVILPGRFLASVEYGEFVIGYAAFLLVYSVHSSMLGEPLLVLLPSSDGEERQAIDRAIERVSSTLAKIGIGLLLAYQLMPLPAVWRTVSLCTAAALCSSMAWEERRRAYASQRASGALWQSVAQLALFGLLLAIGSTLDYGIVSTVMLAVALSALVVGGMARYRRHGVRGVRPALASTDEERGARRKVLHYGRRALASACWVWITANGGYLLLSAAGRLNEVALLRAVLNLGLPFQQLIVGLGLYLTASMSASTFGSRNGGSGPGHRGVLMAAVAGVGYGLMLVSMSGQVLGIAYGGTYDTAAPLLWWLVALGGTWGAQGVLASALRAVRRPGDISRSLLAGNLIAWAALLATGVWTARAVLMATVLLHLTAILVMGARLRRVGLGARAKIGQAVA